MDESTVARAFAKRLAAAREAKGLTQAQLGEQLSVSQQTVAEWEAGRGFPRPARRDRLAEILGIEIGLPPRYAGLVALSAQDRRDESCGVHRSRRPMEHAGDAAFHRDDRPESGLEAAFREALPEPLRPYCDVNLPFGPSKFRADYLSNKVLAELNSNSGMPVDRLSASLWQLATLAKLAQDRRLVLIVVALGPAVRIPQSTQAEAWLHGIEIHLADSAEHAAEIIVALEQGNEPGENPPEPPSEQP